MTKAYSYMRMSTVAQLKGDSLRRQQERSQKYAEAKGWELVPEAEMQDIGLSAYSGANVDEGALGDFLARVHAGSIPSGSVLIVESLDRLSRQQVVKALALFLQILTKGILIATVIDDQVYSGDVEAHQLMWSLLAMQTAYDESFKKSNRLRAAWAQKRRDADKRRLTTKCPGWLTPANDGRGFSLVPERVAIVRRIFEESIQGIGNYAIAKRLNRDGIATFGKSEGWAKSSVAKILNSRAVMGEYQAHRIVGGRRIVEGEPNENYYPVAVEPAIFAQASSARKTRRIGGGGRKGKNHPNLFGQLCHCLYCGSPLHYVNKGKPPKGGQYLVCSRSLKGQCKEGRSLRYQDFETSILTFVLDVDLASIFESSSEASIRKSLHERIETLKGSIEDLRIRRERLLSLVENGVDPRAIAVRLTSLDSSEQARLGELSECESELQGHLSVSDAAHTQSTVATLVEKARTEGPDNYRVRSSIANRLRSLIDRIGVKTAGDAPLHVSPQPEMYEPKYLVKFKNGEVLVVHPHPTDPTKARHSFGGVPKEKRPGDKVGKFTLEAIFPATTQSDKNK